ncbi:MAG TPA: amylo-alpha-1,6-glucosidase [Bryobacteraceae bacterium]|nr:amylo-alpha-1,6-glucosidase [Bryobacteraceae bacterium]
MLEPIHFGSDVLSSAERSLSREWLETNGTGGFASSTIWGMNTRRYHGLLIAATSPPAERMVLLSNVEETVIVGNDRFELAANQYPGVVHPQGWRYLADFRLDPFPTFRYNLGEVSIEKSVFMLQGENTTVVQYTAFGRRSCTMEIRPLVAFRDYHHLTHRNDALASDIHVSAGRVRFQPYEGVPMLYLANDSEAVEKTGLWYLDFEYERERERGLDFSEDLFNPFLLRWELTPGATATIMGTMSAERTVDDADRMRELEVLRRRQLSAAAPVDCPLVRGLVRAADQYIVTRGSRKTIIAGYHWFTDWGRDTMISLPGLTLVTGCHDVAKGILQEFATHVNAGMLPNRFSDANAKPEYNTVDAALWFVEAARAYLAYTSDEEFVLGELYPKLKEIVHCYLVGTRFGIRVDRDGLVHSGEPGSQLTWMDSKIGDWVVTPRIGKPVEIQALWYNAVRVLEELARATGDRSAELFLVEMAEYVRVNFNRLFWNAERECLYDVVDGDERDASIRPNQLMAVSLANSLVDKERGSKILRVVEKHLLTPMGLRTLAPADAAYRDTYTGDVTSRDSAYHQGTAWPWLIGAFITAYRKVYGNGPETTERLRGFVWHFEPHINTAGLGHVSEIADGRAPHNPAGCIAQAWSVAEILRALVEDVHQAVPGKAEQGYRRPSADDTPSR